MKRSVTRRLDRLATNRHGLVTRQELLGLGVTPGQLRHELRSGRVLRLRRGVYRLCGAPSTWEQTVLAACLATGGVASHYTACRLHGSAVVTHDQLTLSVTHGHRKAEGIELRRAAPFPGEETTHRARIPTTSPLRTLEDMASVVDRETVRELATDFLNRRVVTAKQLSDHISSSARRCRRGSGVLRQVVISLLEDGSYDSVAEVRLHEVLLRAGLPNPRRQFRVATPDGQHVGRLDFAWPDRRLNLEMDGYGPHSSPAAFRSNRRRDMRLTALGWTVIRTTPADLEEGADQLLAAIGQILRLPEPPEGRPRHGRGRRLSWHGTVVSARTLTL